MILGGCHGHDESNRQRKSSLLEIEHIMPQSWEAKLIRQGIDRELAKRLVKTSSIASLGISPI
jgi:hypothetical protein